MPRRRRTSRRSREPSVPTDSFSDIAFLLIIFFLLTTTIAKTMGRPVDVPAGEESEQAAEDQLSIELSPRAVLLNEKPVTWAELDQELMLRKLPQRADAQERVVLLKATGQVEYERYFRAMTAVSRAGGVVGIVRQQEGDG